MPIRIPHTQLAPDTLDALLQEVVTRDGTSTADAGPAAARLLSRLEAGDLVITFDEDSGTCAVIPRKDANAAGVE